jgi:uncharacterized membrane protein
MFWTLWNRSIAGEIAPPRLTRRRRALIQRLGRLAVAVAIAVGVLLAPTAHADLTFCNRYSAPVYVAFSWGFTTDSGRAARRVVGWYLVQPGECKAVYFGDLRGKHWSFLAEATDGAYWAGPRRLMVRNQAFDYWWILDGLLGLPSEYYEAGFRDLGWANTTHWTVNLDAG